MMRAGDFDHLPTSPEPANHQARYTEFQSVGETTCFVGHPAASKSEFILYWLLEIFILEARESTTLLRLSLKLAPLMPVEVSENAKVRVMKGCLVIAVE